MSNARSLDDLMGMTNEELLSVFRNGSANWEPEQDAPHPSDAEPNDTNKSFLDTLLDDQFAAKSTSMVAARMAVSVVGLAGCVASLKTGQYVFDQGKKMTPGLYVGYGLLTALMSFGVGLSGVEMYRRRHKSSSVDAKRQLEHVPTDKLLISLALRGTGASLSAFQARRGRDLFHRNPMSKFGRSYSGMSVGAGIVEMGAIAHELSFRREELEMMAHAAQISVREVMPSRAT